MKNQTPVKKVCMPYKNHCLNLPSSIPHENFSHSFAAFLISFSIMGTSVFAFSISLLYNFYIFIVQKVEYTKKPRAQTCASVSCIGRQVLYH